MEVGEEGDYILSATVSPRNNSCIKMGSDESHFNVSLIVRDKVTRQCPQTTQHLNRKESRSRFEPRSLCFDGADDRGRLYTNRSTVTTRMTPALRWAAMRAILMFYQL